MCRRWAKHLDIEATLGALFYRECKFHWKEYMVAGEAELQKDLTWALSRRSHPGGGTTFFDALLPTEKDRLREYRTLKPASKSEACDLGQNPERIPMMSLGGCLQTIIKGVGLLWVSDSLQPHPSPLCNDGRWLVPSELGLAMGFPLTISQVAALGRGQVQFIF